MKKLREILGEKFSKGMEDWLKNNQTTRNIQAREPKEPSKFPPIDPNWADKMHDKFNAIENRRYAPKTVIPGPVDFTGSRHSTGSDDVKLVDPSLNQNWRSKKEGIGSYQQPPGYDTPGFEKSKQKMAAATAMGDEPPMPGAGPYKTKQSDPLKSTPIIVTADKPMLSKDPAVIAALGKKGYDPTGKKVTAIPKQTGVGKAEIPLPSNEKIPSGVGITTPGSFTYSDSEKKPKQITDRIPPSKLYTDRVPQTKQITDRVPQEPPNVSTKAMGPFTISKDDPNSLRYQKIADLSKYASRTRTKPESNQLDNTKNAVPAPKLTSTSLDLTKPKKLRTITVGSGKGTNTLWDIAKGRVGKGGDVNKEIERIRKLNKNIDPGKLQKGQSLTIEAATYPNTKYVPGLTQPGKQMDKRITDRVPETIPKQYTDRVPQENPKPTVSPQKFYDVPAGTFRPQYELQKGDLGPKTMKRLSTEVPKGSSDAAYAAMIGSIINRVGDKGFTSNKSIGQVFSDKNQFPKQPKTKVTPEFEKRMTSIATDVAAGKFPAVEKGADQWRATSYLNTPRNQVWGKQGGKKVKGGKGKAAYQAAMAQNAPQVGKQTFIKTSPEKGSHDPYELPKMTKDPNTGVIRKAEAGEPVLPEKGFASSGGMVKNKPATVSADSAPKVSKEPSAVHKVRKGQSAEQIAKQYNLDLNKLEKLNPGITRKSNKGKLFPGETIKVK